MTAHGPNGARQSAFPSSDETTEHRPQHPPTTLVLTHPGTAHAPKLTLAPALEPEPVGREIG